MWIIGLKIIWHILYLHLLHSSSDDDVTSIINAFMWQCVRFICWFGNIFFCVHSPHRISNVSTNQIYNKETKNHPAFQLKWWKPNSVCPMFDFHAVIPINHTLYQTSISICAEKNLFRNQFFTDHVFFALYYWKYCWNSINSNTIKMSQQKILPEASHILHMVNKIYISESQQIFETYHIINASLLCNWSESN